MVRKKAPVTIESCLKEDEIMLHRKAGEIVHAKQIGISQPSINKMVYEFTLSKRYYDVFKGRITDGK